MGRKLKHLYFLIKFMPKGKSYVSMPSSDLLPLPTPFFHFRIPLSSGLPRIQNERKGKKKYALISLCKHSRGSEKKEKSQVSETLFSKALERSSRLLKEAGTGKKRLLLEMAIFCFIL